MRVYYCEKSYGKRLYLSDAVRCLFAAVMIAAFAAGCGGGGGGGGSTPVRTPVSSTPTTGAVSGRLFSAAASRPAADTQALRIPVQDAKVTCASVSSSSNSEGAFLVEAVPAGRQLCSVSRQGFLASQFYVDVVAGQTVEVNPDDLKPEKVGGLAITSQPAGAKVYLEGFEIGAVTPVSLDTVVAGEHSVSVRLDGYEPATRTVAVDESATATVDFVLERLVTQIALDPGDVAMSVGDEKNIGAVCMYADGTSAGCADALEWVSSDVSVITVAAGGKVKAVSPGSATVAASRPQSSISFPGVSITVSCPDGKAWSNGACGSDVLLSIGMQQTSVALAIGESAPLTPLCTWRDAGLAPCPQLDWQFTSPGIASMSGNLLTALSEGSVSLSASSGGVTSGVVAVTVSDAFAEPDCAAASGICFDIVGAQTAADGTVTLDVRMKNAPPQGLRAGALAFSWDPDELAFVSSSMAQGLVQEAQNVSQSNEYRVVFSSAAPLSGDSLLMTLSMRSAAAAPSAPASVSWITDVLKTNFTDFDFNLLSQNGIVFRNAFVLPRPRS